MISSPNDDHDIHSGNSALAIEDVEHDSFIVDLPVENRDVHSYISLPHGKS